MSSWCGPLTAPTTDLKFSSRRFKALPAEDITSLTNYIYHILRAKGSGEYSICESLASVHARPGS